MRIIFSKIGVIHYNKFSMKQFLLYNRLVAILVAVLLTLSLRAGNDIVLKKGQPGKLAISESSYQHLKMVNTLSSLQYFNVKTIKGEFVKLQAGEYAGSNTYGSPQLPVLGKLIEIPLSAIPAVKVISYTVKEYKLSEFGINLPLFPAQPPVSKSESNPEFIYDASAYQQNSFTGNDLATVEVLGILRGTRLGRINISPVQYNPVTNMIRVYDNLVIDVTFAGANVSLTKAEKRKYDSPYFRTVYNRLINYQQTDNRRDTMSKNPIKYVIVSPQIFHDALQPFISWKRKKGFTVVEAYTNNPAVGTTTTSIKNYLHGLYTAATPIDPAPSFVLFVGDVAQIPAFPCAAGHVTDLYYCEYTGDYLPEVYYGRFSANTVAQLQPQIDKTLEYEQYLMPDPSFLNEDVMAAGADANNQMTYGNGQINYGTSNYFNEAHGLTSHTYLQPEPAGVNYSQQIQTNISNGVCYANYTAHGSPSGWANPSFTISDIPALQNAHKYPLIVGNCCSTSTYNGTCFAEELLRAANKGALGYIGASNSSYWDEDYWWGIGVGPISAHPTYAGTTLGAYDRTFHDHGEPYEEWYSTMDQMIFAGNLAVTESGSGMKEYYWQIYCLMGDPSLMVYFSQPLPMTVTYSPLMPLASNTFTVNAEPYAYIAISRNGLLYGAAEADSLGVAIVSLNPITVPGLADVVVTKQNRQPYIGTVVVASPDGPYVLLDSYQIDDSNGNNNQIAEFGENILFNITLKNVGNSNATNVTSILTCNDEFLRITSDSAVTPLIQSQSTSIINGAFAASIAGFLPDQHVVFFTITSHSDTNSWTSNFSLTLYAPRLKTGQFSMDDAVGGNGNGIIEPGETVIISIPTINYGHCAATTAIGTLLSTSSFVTFNNTSSNLGTLATGGIADGEFSITISPDAPIGSVLQLHYFAASGPYNVLMNLYLGVGELAEDFETGDFSKFNWQTSGDMAWGITQNNPQQGTFSARSGIIADNQTSVLSLSGNVLMNDTISFFYKVSSEAGYDFLKFYIDGEEKQSWSGNLSWSKIKFPVAAGQHIFKWSYEKDFSTTAGADAAMIDYIVFPPIANSLNVDAVAFPATVCTGGQTQLFGIATGGSGVYTYAWSPSGGLSDTTIFNPVATPSGSMIYTVRVGNILSYTSANVAIALAPIPETPVIILNGANLVSSAATGNQWYNMAGPIIGATEATYAPEHTSSYYVIVSTAAGCRSEVSNSIYVAFTGLKEIIPQLAIYPNPSNGKFEIALTLFSNSKIKLAIYNALGNAVAVLIEGKIEPAGQQIMEVELLNMPVGVYFCKLFTTNEIVVKKLVCTR